MRILVHDYSGHPFQVQLSRWLAEQGHTVCHAYSAAVETPRGPLAPAPDDPATFQVVPLGTGGRLAKYRFAARLCQEARYARRVIRLQAAFAPDVVLSGNCSPLIQIPVARAARRRKRAFVYWCQDLYAPALTEALARRHPVLGALAAPLARHIESRALRAADRAVAISPAFGEAMTAAGVAPERIRTIPNWAPPLDPPPDDGAAWRARHGLSGKVVFLYAGTLGQKHDPARLAALARAFRDDPAVAIAVASQGPGRTALETWKAREGLANLHLMDFLPFEALPAALRAADVLLALLSRQAGRYAVPSKVLTGLRSGRATLASLPPENLAAEVLSDSGAGLTVAPEDAEGWLDAARRLRADAALRERLGERGPIYAARHFDIARIGAEFTTVFEAALRERRCAEIAPWAGAG
jgi:glycosyltransferase involved in cell wall biosynthesis